MNRDETKDHRPYYPKDSAGRIMTPNVPTVKSGATIGDVEALLVGHARDFDSINYVYVLGGDGELAGAVSIKEIFDQESGIKVSDIMHRDVVSVRAHTDQERAAYKALKHNIKALPVVDKEGKFLGAVPSDQILYTLYKEAGEDVARFAGIYRSEASLDSVMRLPVRTSVWHRLPWLLVGLLGGVAAAKIIELFEATLATHVILAAFIPLVVYMAGATSMQMTVFVVRDYAVDPAIRFGKYFLRHLAILFFVSAISAATLYLLGIVLFADAQIRLVLAIALFVTMLSSILSGLLVPYLFMKFTFDPADASAPIVTIIQDVLAVIIYFTIATLLL